MIAAREPAQPTSFVEVISTKQEMANAGLHRRSCNRPDARRAVTLAPADGPVAAPRESLPRRRLTQVDDLEIGCQCRRECSHLRISRAGGVRLADQIGIVTPDVHRRVFMHD